MAGVRTLRTEKAPAQTWPEQQSPSVIHTFLITRLLLPAYPYIVCKKTHSTTRAGEMGVAAAQGRQAAYRLRRETRIYSLGRYISIIQLTRGAEDSHLIAHWNTSTSNVEL